MLEESPEKRQVGAEIGQVFLPAGWELGASKEAARIFYEKSADIGRNALMAGVAAYHYWRSLDEDQLGYGNEADLVRLIVGSVRLSHSLGQDTTVAVADGSVPYQPEE